MGAFFTKDELLFFYANGYVVKKNVLDKQHCEEVVDIAWRQLPDTFDKNNRQTWRGEVTCSCCVTQDIKKRRGHVRIRKESIGKYHEAQKLVAKNKDVISMVQELVGAPLAPAIFRGLYFTFPIPKLFSFPHYGHLESHPFQIGTVAYCSDVKKNGGGLNVWPGSHWSFQEAFEKKIGFHANDKYKKCAKQFNSIRPLTIEGNVGDVIFTHHRLFHAPSNNNNEIPRAAFFCDFRADNWLDLEQENSSGNPFETFASFQVYSKKDSEDFCLSYNDKPELMRVLTNRFPMINRIYKNFVGNETTVARSKVSFRARFNK